MASTIEEALFNREISEAFTEGFTSYPNEDCPYISGAKKEAWWRGFRFAKQEEKNLSKMS